MGISADNSLSHQTIGCDYVTMSQMTQTHFFFVVPNCRNYDIWVPDHICPGLGSFHDGQITVGLCHFTPNPNWGVTSAGNERTQPSLG